ncbi:MAG: GGDEF domain-containing protein [Leptothrix sp. (in: Bacteria)]|nr:GGDEF domain-containing protein [Leptothrix sp. (in: b-proteobacteria)]
MSRVIEQLAELTGFRDRDVLDVSLVGALMDLLQPEALGIYRVVGEDPDRCWLTRAYMRRGDTTATADPLWAEPGSLPSLDSMPERLACLRSQEADETPGPPSVARFPMVTEWQAVGVLEITSKLPLTAENLRLVGSILRIYRNFQSLLDYSERDTLTGLLNRKTFDDGFLRVATRQAQTPVRADGREGAGQRRPAQGDALWLAVIDIDHFKRVNDAFGHLIGDEVLLLLLSRLMRSSFRFHDHLYRFGGEEFVVLMCCSDADAAMTALQRLRQNVQAYRFPQVEHITVSVGCTALRVGDTPNAAFERADQALYHVKQNGRNQVADHGRLVALGQLSETAHDSDIEMF